MNAPLAPIVGARARAKVATKAKVIAAAKVVFGTLGYDRATIRDIARTAGLSTGAIFASFEGKAQLFQAAISEPAPTSNTIDASQKMLAALKVAERFMVGFEGDHLQDGIDEQLAQVRAAIAQAEGRS